jgi:hypothetical protein
MPKKISIGNQLPLPMQTQATTDLSDKASRNIASERCGNVIYFHDIKKTSSTLEDPNVIKTIQLFAKTLDW